MNFIGAICFAAGFLTAVFGINDMAHYNHCGLQLFEASAVCFLVTAIQVTCTYYTHGDSRGGNDEI